LQFDDWGPNSEEDTKRFIKNSIKRSNIHPRIDYELAVIFTPTNKLLGGASLILTRGDKNTATIGCCITPQYQGLGFGSETIKALIDFGLNTLKLTTIQTIIDARNYPSILASRRNGMLHVEKFYKSWKHQEPVKTYRFEIKKN